MDISKQRAEEILQTVAGNYGMFSDFPRYVEEYGKTDEEKDFLKGVEIYLGRRIKKGNRFFNMDELLFKEILSMTHPIPLGARSLEIDYRHIRKLVDLFNVPPGLSRAEHLIKKTKDVGTKKRLDWALDYIEVHRLGGLGNGNVPYLTPLHLERLSRLIPISKDLGKLVPCS